MATYASAPLYARPTVLHERTIPDDTCDCSELIAKVSTVFMGVVAILAAYALLHTVASFVITGIVIFLAYQVLTSPCSDPFPAAAYTTTTMRPLYHQPVTTSVYTHSYQPVVYTTPMPTVYQQPVRQHYVTTTTYQPPAASYAEARALPGGRGAVSVNFRSASSSRACSNCPPLPPQVGAGQHAVPRRPRS